MNDMPARMLADWAKEEVRDAVSDRFCELLQNGEGLTVAETAAFRRQQRRVAKLLGFGLGPTEPAQAIEAGTDETRNAAQPEGRERGPKGAPE